MIFGLGLLVVCQCNFAGLNARI
ncbi:hypothetical protein [Trichormus azollae]